MEHFKVEIIEKKVSERSERALGKTRILE